MAFNELRAIATFAKAAELGSLRQAAAAQASRRRLPARRWCSWNAPGRAPVPPHHAQPEPDRRGEQFLEAAQPGLATLQQRALHGARRGREEIAGPLRIAAPRSIMLEVLWPVLEEFCRRYPRSSPTCSWTTASATGSRTASTSAFAPALRPGAASSRGASC
jgi:hypothetical protein